MNINDLILRCSLSPDDRWDACSTLYSGLVSGEIQTRGLMPHASVLASFWNEVDDQVRPFQKRSGNSWRWAEDYQDPRNEASLLLDILGYLPDEAVFQELRRACTLQDPLLVMGASVSLLRYEQTMDPAVLELVAASDETCLRWERSLLELGLQHLLPAEYADPECRARARLVEWLIHPTEWECAPDDVELIGVVGEQYVFQFRSRLGYHWSSEHGWVAGIASEEGAFSDYQSAILAEPEEHARRMTGRIETSDS